MQNKYENFLSKIKNLQSMTKEITNYYNDEYIELFEDILTKHEGEFMHSLSLHVKSTIQETYSNRAFENIKFIQTIKSVETHFYTNFYQVDKNQILSQYDHTKDSKDRKDFFFFRKHCKYQEDHPLHPCDTQTNFFKIIYNYISSSPRDKKSNKYQKPSIWGIVCTKCKKAYKSNYIKLYCNFCYSSYYSCIEDNSSLNNINIQPATWEKYHCNLILNEQMKCILCKNLLYYDIKRNILLCKVCNFKSEPNQILWKCLKCGQEFHSNAKIYNPYEYKPLALAIKKAMYEKISAVPKLLPCNHSPNGLTHNKNCKGEMYVAYLNDRKMVLCSLCNTLTKYNRFVWVCPICGERFRDDGSFEEHEILLRTKMKDEINKSAGFKKTKSIGFDNTIILNKEKVQNLNEQFKKMPSKFNDINDSEFLLNEDYTPKKKAFSVCNRRINSSINELPNIEKSTDVNIDINNNNNNDKGNGNESELEKNNISIPLFDLNEYDIISQINVGKKSKIYCVKTQNASEFFAMKKESFSSQEELSQLLFQYALQYSMNNNNFITHIKFINIKEDEINIIEELGMNNWNSELISMKKMKKIYTEQELVLIIYQISQGLEDLKTHGYAHFNINPMNVIVFKDKTYKVTDFGSIKSIKNPSFDRSDKNKFISPNLSFAIRNCLNAKEVDLIKSDVYSLALCIIFAWLPNNEISGMIMDFVGVDLNKMEKEKDYTHKMILKYMKYPSNLNKGEENVYSMKFIGLLEGMLSIDEKERFDFHRINKYIEENYNY